jgi:hypothetical protein
MFTLKIIRDTLIVFKLSALNIIRQTPELYQKCNNNSVLPIFPKLVPMTSSILPTEFNINRFPMKFYINQLPIHGYIKYNLLIFLIL